MNIKYIQFKDDAETLQRISDFVDDEIRISYHDPDNPILYIHTENGYLKANISDVIAIEDDNISILKSIKEMIT